jgi:2-polyprenyl-3-methyl-5-hydroxy-6-metoxy-1,4-benzoquinol methylase
MITRLFRRLFARGEREPMNQGGQHGLICPICRGGKAPVLFDATRPQRLVICPECRHVFWDRVPTPEELQRFYEQEYCESHDQQNIQEKIRVYYREHVEQLLRILGRPREEVCLVDYGSSIPTLVREARDLGVGRPIAVEVDRKSWEYAERHGLAIMTPAQYAEQMPAGSVDVIRFSHVLEHLVDPTATVAQAVEKLRPGGILYITQPSFPVLRPRRLDRPLKDSVYPTHLHFFSPISLVKMLSRFPVQIANLITSDRQEEVYAEWAAAIDLEYARKKLADQANTGEPTRGPTANYPIYAGENSAVCARKRAA